MGVSTLISSEMKNTSFENETGKIFDTKNDKHNISLLKIIFLSSLRAIGLLICLYFFIITLDLMSSGFQLIAGLLKYMQLKISFKNSLNLKSIGMSASNALGSQVILENPISGLVIGLNF